MRRNATGAVCALVLSMCASAAHAVDVEPYFEYRVAGDGFPTTYYFDIDEAAAEVAARECQLSGYKDCKVTKTEYFNSLYFVYYSYKYPDGRDGSSSKWNYHYYTCDNPPSLYIVRGDDVWGPYPNREMAPPPPWGAPVCRYESTPGPGEDAEHQSDLGPGDCETRPNVGNPINVGLNNKYQEVVDIAATTGSPLSLSRYYNSGIVGEGETPNLTVPEIARLGSRWRHTYDRSLAFVSTKDGNAIRLQRHTGVRIDFVESGGSYRSTVDPRGQLTRAGEGWAFRAPDGQTEVYDKDGRLTALDPGTARQLRLIYTDALVEVIDPQGRKLSFAYDTAGRIASVGDGAGTAVTYAYSEKDETGRQADLVTSTYADGAINEYLYNEASFNGGTSHPHALTGIVDETKTRFATFWYDGSGRAIHSEHAAGADSVHLVRSKDGDVTVTGPTNAVHRYHFADVRGSRRLTGVDQPGGAGCGAAYSKIEYDDKGLVPRRTDFDGRVTEFRYDGDGNEIERTEAPGTSLARKTSTQWQAALAKPVRITWPGREERFTYDTHGNMTSRETWGAIDPTQVNAPLVLSRTWRMVYDGAGRPVTEEGPRSDTGKVGAVTRYTYRAADAANCTATGACDYRKGDLWKTENALGHVDEVLSLDTRGRTLSRRDEQGTLFTYTYTARGWLAQVRETRPDGKVATIVLTYTPRGDVDSVTDADGVTLRFQYDGAGRLTMVSNPSNHRLEFKLDAAGRRIQETGYDSLFLKTQLKRTFDALGRVETEIDGTGAVTRFTYDELGRPTGVTDADGHREQSSYDALGRLRSAIADADGLAATTQASYDPLDQLTAIEDAKGVTTRYLTTGLGDAASVDSPDGGLVVDEHDVAGLIIRHEGPAGIASFQANRDALGRLLTVRYSDAKLDKRFEYDAADSQCPAGERHAVGRLSAMAQGDNRTVYCYDAPGNITRKIQRWGMASKTVSYAYSLAGRITDVIVDGGSHTTYRYDIDGSLAGIKTQLQGQAAVDVITYVAYRPFDLIESWRYGNGREMTISRDNAGRVTSWSGIDPGNSLYAIGYSKAGNVESLTAKAYQYRLGYDGLGYLSSVEDMRSGGKRDMAYDRTGDRQSETVDGVRHSYPYDPASHRLNRVDDRVRRYDAAGNTIAIGAATLAYDAAGRLASASEQGRLLVSYGYDADGIRIARTEAAGARTLLMLYDEDGRWLADYDTTGKVIRQAIWMGDYLVGLTDGGRILYVEPDHLGTPRAVVDPTRNAAVWRWRPSDDVFGGTAPDEDPDADGASFVFDTRFPGQRYDALTRVLQNGRRDYDPVAGRYLQVDPIGLAGGINPYLYANGSPLMYTDPDGEIGILGAGIGAAVELGIQALSNYRSGCDVFDPSNYNWIHVGTSAVFGAVSAGWVSVGRKALYSRGAINALRGQLTGAKSASRVQKLQARIAKNKTRILHAVTPQVGLQVTKMGAKELTSSSAKYQCGCSS